MAKNGNAIAKVRAEDDWQAESDLRTVIECEKIEKDPARMKRVRALAKARLLEVASVASDEAE